MSRYPILDLLDEILVGERDPDSARERGHLVVTGRWFAFIASCDGIERAPGHLELPDHLRADDFVDDVAAWLVLEPGHRPSPWFPLEAHLPGRPHWFHHGWPS